MIQGVSDNFDAHLSTQNGLKQTHSLASIVIQHTTSPIKVMREPLPRLKKNQLATVSINDVNMKVHIGEKKPQMPELFAKIGVLPLRILCNQVIIARRSKNEDFLFIKESLKEESSMPDYGGYNTRRARENG